MTIVGRGACEVGFFLRLYWKMTAITLKLGVMLTGIGKLKRRRCFANCCTIVATYPYFLISRCVHRTIKPFYRIKIDENRNYMKTEITPPRYDPSVKPQRLTCQSKLVITVLFVTVVVTGLLSGCRSAIPVIDTPQYPVTPELFIDQFWASEGITFNAKGQLFIGANKAVWLVDPNGNTKKLTEVDLHLGQARIGDRDILAADFGPVNVFSHGPNNDGVVWRISPEGDKTVAAQGIADPNFILVLEDGSFLVSDDGCDRIYHVTPEGEVSLWSDAIDYPNGMALSKDGTAIYVAQIFEQLDPFVPSDKIWIMPIKHGKPAGPPTLLARTGGSMVDGLALDELGRIYVADNGSGSIRRIDPDTGAVVVIAEGMPHVASLVFGEGDFDHQTIYATSTRRGGGKIWKVKVGIKGASLLQ